MATKQSKIADGIINGLVIQGAIYGAMCGEWVLDNGLTDVVDFVLDLQNQNFKGNYAKALCDHAYNKGSLDNVTVVVYFFQTNSN